MINSLHLIITQWSITSYQPVLWSINRLILSQWTIDQLMISGWYWPTSDQLLLSDTKNGPLKAGAFLTLLVDVTMDLPLSTFPKLIIRLVKGYHGYHRPPPVSTPRVLAILKSLPWTRRKITPCEHGRAMTSMVSMRMRMVKNGIRMVNSWPRLVFSGQSWLVNGEWIANSNPLSIMVDEWWISGSEVPVVYSRLGQTLACESYS